MDKKRIIFCGTPKIASECLLTLLQHNEIDIVGVIAQVDKVNARNKKIIYSEVKQVCLDNHLNLMQFENINHHVDEIKSLNPDLIITCAFGQFICDAILNIPKYKCVNIHASLLPKLRGGAPIHWSIINGYKSTGISLMYMIKKMDAGNVIYQESLLIEENDTYDSLYLKLTQLAKNIINNKLMFLFNQNLNSIVQNEDEVTFGLNITKEQEIIDFNDSAINIRNKIRGLYSKPGAKLVFNEQKYKINDCTISENKSNKPCGYIVDIKNQLAIATKDFDILINMIQPPNKNWLSWKQYVNGQTVFKVGDIIK